MTLDTMDGLLQALKRLRVETGSLACLGCGHEHDCGVRGCAIMRKAVERLSGMTRANHPDITDRVVPLTQADINTMHFERVWIDYGAGGEDGVILYGKLYSIDTLDGAGFEELLLDATGHGGESLGTPSGEYTIYRCPKTGPGQESARTLEAWVSVEEKLPDAEEEVRLLCVTSWGRHYQCQGFYVPPGTYRDDSGYSWDWECCEEYDEERDDYLVNPGWYESIHNWDEYSACGIADKVTNWMPLPEEPEDMEKRARGIKKDGT